jgi:signal transduction histidine kinase
MDSPVAPRGSFEDEGQKLKACEENLRRYHQLALAGRLVGATMHEVNNRLAALTNLIFLARTLSGCSLQSVEYLDEADSQLRSLGEITSRSLAFIRLDTEAKEIDLVELATSALRLHHEQISKKRINVQTRSSEAALARVKRVKSSRWLRISCSTPSRHCLIPGISMYASPCVAQMRSSRLQTMELEFRSR